MAMNRLARQRSPLDISPPNAFWAVFCAAALLAVPAIAIFHSAQAAEVEHQVPDFSGYWVRPENGNGRIFYPPESGPGPIVGTDDTREFMIGDDTNPILLPHAAAAVRAHGDYGRADRVALPAWSLCWPPGIPLILNMAETVQLLQTPDRVTILYQRGMQVRHIYLNKEHPEGLEPSWFGHSIGHYEGSDTLVIETIAQDIRSTVDRFGTPHSEAMRVVERYTLSADGQRLGIKFTVEDPETFTVPWSARTGYVRPSARAGYRPEREYSWRDIKIIEMVCAENNRDPEGGYFVIPVDETLDF